MARSQEFIHYLPLLRLEQMQILSRRRIFQISSSVWSPLSQQLV